VIALAVPLLVLLLSWRGVEKLRRTRRATHRAQDEVHQQLCVRADLITGLVERTSRLAPQERDLCHRVLVARACSMLADTAPRRRETEDQLQDAVADLLAAGDVHPRLGDDRMFRRLCGDLRRTEERLQDARARYNRCVEEHNQKRRSFPQNLLASHLDRFDACAQDELATCGPRAEVRVKP
jgi:LemA protein